MIFRTWSRRRATSSWFELLAVMYPPDTPRSGDDEGNDTVKFAMLDRRFTEAIGMFVTVWQQVEITTDFAIGKFLNASSKETHLITVGMMFGRKSKLLTDLIKRSDHPDRNKILQVFGRINAKSNLRDMIVHSYCVPDRDFIRFINRSKGGPYMAKSHVMLPHDFYDSCFEMYDDLKEFVRLVGPADLYSFRGFAEDALRASRKPEKSAGRPASTAE